MHGADGVDERGSNIPAVDQRTTFLIARMERIRAIAIHIPGDRRICHPQVNVLNQHFDLD